MGKHGNSVRLYFGGSKITADGDCSHEIKRRLLLGRKVMTNLDSILKSRDTTLPAKVHLVKAMVFPVVMYECESWTIKKAECQRIDAFELWCWRRLLRVPWTTRRSNQSILKGNQSWIFIGKTDADAEVPILWPPDAKNWLVGKRPWCWEGLKAGGKGDNRGWNGWMVSPTQWTWVEQAPGVGEGQGSLVCCSLWGRKESDTTEGLNWTEVGYIILWVNNIHLLLKNLKRNFWDTFYERWNECPAAVGCSVLLGVIDW